MTDQYFTAEQREIIETMFHHASVGEFLEDMSHYVRDLKNLRPAPRPKSEHPFTDYATAAAESARFPWCEVQHRRVTDWQTVRTARHDNI